MKHLPFSVFRRAGRPFFQVKFKNSTGTYSAAISTGKEKESEAIEIAYRWYRDGIPKKGGAVSLTALSLRDAIRDSDFSLEDCGFLCGELQRRGLLESFTVAKSRAAVPFTDFLRQFWDYDNSSYIKEKLRKKHAIHKNYAKGQNLTILKYWMPFFTGRILGDIARVDIDKFIDSLEETKLSAGRRNAIIRAGLIPLKWAFQKDMINRDVTAGHTMFSGKAKERQILTPELAAAAFKADWSDERSKLANLLAAISGMRSGEILGLRVRDLGKDCLYVNHSWNVRDGLKTTKNNEARTVEMFPEIVKELITLAEKSPHKASLESFIFWAEQENSKPMEAKLFNKGLREALGNIGLTREAAGNYVFHGWRHFFVTHMKKRIETRLLQLQTGHKTIAMIERYGNHGLSNDRQVIQSVQREVFGGLIPSFVDRMPDSKSLVVIS